MLFCSNDWNAAKRRYVQGTAGVMLAYIGLLSASRIMVHRWQPQGWHLYLAAALPTIPILCLGYIVARYLREERDEYQRDIVVRCLLWATAVTLSVSVFGAFLRAYGWRGELPPFTEFMTFWITVALARLAHRIATRSVSDE